MDLRTWGGVRVSRLGREYSSACNITSASNEIDEQSKIFSKENNLRKRLGRGQKEYRRENAGSKLFRTINNKPNHLTFNWETLRSYEIYWKWIVIGSFI